MDAITYALSKKYTDNKIAESAGLRRQIVTSLPTTGDEKIIYMVRVSNDNEDSDNYNEYMWIDSNWELIGNTRVDLSDYYNKTQVDIALNGKANTSDIPTALSQLSADATHRVVTDTEKSTWNDKCQGGSTTATRDSIASQMDALKAAGKSGVFPFYISSGNADFPTTGYCMAIGAIHNGGVSTITAVNSQTGDIWTNANTSQVAGNWRGWKKIGDTGSVIVEKLSVTSMATILAGGISSIEKTATKQGYTPIGIVGVYLNKPSWQQYYPHLAIAGSYVYKSGNNYYAEVLLYNPTGSEANCTGDIYVLYVKN